MPFTASAYIPSIKPGLYQAICIDTEEKVNPKDPTNIFRVWHFQLTDGSLRTVDGTSSLLTSGTSKGGKWSVALIGHQPVAGEEVAPEGKPCTIVVGINEKTGYEKVDDVLPPAVTGESAARQHAIQEGDDLPF